MFGKREINTQEETEKATENSMESCFLGKVSSFIRNLSQVT